MSQQKSQDSGWLEIPTICSERLVLRPFRLEDAPMVQRLAGAREISANVSSIPHPYEDGVAEKWISSHEEGFRQERSLNLAITLADKGQLVGAIGLLNISRENQRAEIGYWVGLPWWGQGYCTEAARAFVCHAFTHMGLNRMVGQHLTRNPASGRVMAKIGMKHEGTLRQHLSKGGVLEDVEYWAVLKEEFNG